MEKLIAQIPKNSREEIRVTLSEFESNGKTHDMISARVFYDAGDGEMKPGKNGLNVSVRLLPALVEALQKAESEARAAGLLESDEPERHADPDRARNDLVKGATILGGG